MAEPEARVVRARVPGSEYDIMVKAGLLDEVGPRLRDLFKSKRVGVITDDAIAPLYLSRVEQSLKQAGFDVVRAVVPAGEGHKTLATVSSIFDQLFAVAVERSMPVLSLGGGVIGDMGGFVAASILRGVPFVQVPTTLLSMVDASIGGKTGVNHAVGKNLIGAFHQPVAVFIDPAVLRTLPPRELRSGLAECIKHEVIRDADGFAGLERNVDRALSLDVDYLAELIAHNVSIKARVVEQDPFERGDRAHLNFGHTFGHAIETVSRYAYAHGECVALGMVAASRLAERLGMLDGASVQRITELTRRAGLPVGGMTLPVDDVVGAMMYDKKVKAGKVRFILPTRIGAVTIRDDVPPALVREAAASLSG